MTKTFVPSLMLLVVFLGLMVVVAPVFAQRGQVVPPGPEQMGQPLPGDIPTEDPAKSGGMSMTWIIIIIAIVLAAVVFAVIANNKNK